MRRILAIALLVVLALPAALSLVSVSRFQASESQLPACCRRDGKHHCAMKAMAESASQETSFRQEPIACPYRLSVQSSPTVVLYPASTTVLHTRFLEHATARIHVTIHLFSLQASAHQKRGPPPTFFFA